MSEITSERDVAYHLYVDPDEVPVARLALGMLISDEAHEPQIRRLAREVLLALAAQPNAEGILTVGLSPEQMKITHTAVRLLLNDLGREQDSERQILWRILQKLPDEHAIRAIELG
jgi:altronate dehydratase